MTCALLQAQTAVRGSVVLTGTPQAKRDYSNVAVWLEPQSRTSLTAVPVAHKKAVILQKDKRFTPHLLVVQSGTSIDFPNADPIFHNAFSNFDGQLFDIGLYPPGTSRAVTFSRPGIVRVFCNIHSTMSAVIVVVDSAYYTTTLKDGSFIIPSVDKGEYVLHFFDERTLPEALERLKRPITIAAESLTLERVTISEAGYLPTSHKNKYGREYRPEPNDSYTPISQ